LTLFEQVNGSEGKQKHEGDDQESAEDSHSVLDALDVSVFPDDVCWLCGV
jgi:hypothetical protein